MKLIAYSVVIFLLIVQEWRTILKWWFEDVRKWTKVWYADGTHVGWGSKRSLHYYYFPEYR